MHLPAAAERNTAGRTCRKGRVAAACLAGCAPSACPSPRAHGYLRALPDSTTPRRAARWQRPLRLCRTARAGCGSLPPCPACAPSP
ncbi:hypothetical protein G6F23_015329 [Rhizopus arrhizus]|nr:hypothetical protein G6F23_015329 [Rhizopus arrhizus]